MQTKHEPLRRFIAAAVCDFAGYLDTQVDPIIVGGQYPKDKLIECLHKWCETRNFNVENADSRGWLTVCTAGLLKMPGNPPVQGDSDDST